MLPRYIFFHEIGSQITIEDESMLDDREIAPIEILEMFSASVRGVFGLRLQLRYNVAFELFRYLRS
jgi:hypothetical protein